LTSDLATNVLYYGNNLDLPFNSNRDDLFTSVRTCPEAR